MKKSAFFIFAVMYCCILPLFCNCAFASEAPSNNITLYTHTIGLEPIPDTYQTAKSTFLPDRFDDLGLANYSSFSTNYNTANCDMYPHSSCPAGGRCETCPFNVKQYRVVACKDPYYLSGGTCVCPAKVSLVYANDRCTKYCGSTCIAKSCTPTSNQSGCTNGTQSCDNGCGANTRQCCVPCSHKVTSKPANSSYTYSSCYDGTTKQIQTGWKCNSGYHQKDNECEQDCISNNCSGYPLSNKPDNASFSECTIKATNCTTSGTKYKIDSCNSGYHLSNNSCVAHSYSCPSGYQSSACSDSQVQTGSADKTCSCGATNGKCYTCRAKTCEEKGQKTCNGSCISTSECCGGCGTGQKCENGTCVTTCVAGGSASCSGVSSCGSNQVQTSSCMTCSGTTLYTCRAKNCAEQGLKDCNGSCIAKTECCGGCSSGQECSNGTCVITEGTITVIHQFPSGFAQLSGGPWWILNYIDPDGTPHNFGRGTADSTTYSWSTTPMESKLKLGGVLKVGINEIQLGSGTYAYCRSSPSPASTSATELQYNIPKGNANVTITYTYCKK